MSVISVIKVVTHLPNLRSQPTKAQNCPLPFLHMLVLDAADCAQGRSHVWVGVSSNAEPGVPWLPSAMVGH